MNYFNIYDEEYNENLYDVYPYETNMREARNRDKNNEEPSLKYIPPEVIRDYVGEVINTFIPGYGRRNVYVRGISRQGMVSLVILRTNPNDCISVHYSDISGISKPQFRC